MKAVSSRLPILLFAVVAIAFALLPVITDVPWEGEESFRVTEGLSDERDPLRCEAALAFQREFRIAVLTNAPFDPALRDALERWSDGTEQDILTYC